MSESEYQKTVIERSTAAKEGFFGVKVSESKTLSTDAPYLYRSEGGIMITVPEEIRESAKSLINALYALSPSRNEIVRYMVVSKDMSNKRIKEEFPWMPENSFKFEVVLNYLHKLPTEWHINTEFEMSGEEKEAFEFLSGIKKDELPNTKKEYKEGMRPEIHTYEEIPEETKRFVDALLALSPSRNLISRAYILSESSPIIAEFEELFSISPANPFFREIKDAVNRIFRFLEGRPIDDKIGLNRGRFLIDFLADEDVKNALSFLSDGEDIPNLKEEFGKQLLETIKQDEENGENMIKILKLYKNGEGSMKVKEIMDKTGLGIEELKQTLKAYSSNRAHILILNSNHTAEISELNEEDEVTMQHFITKLIIEAI